MISIVVGPLGTITTKFEKYIEVLELRLELNMFKNLHCQEQLE